jgi:hypothetical protein
MQQAPSITFLSVSLEAWLTILAIIIGPLAALLIQKRLENRRAKEDRKIKIFREIMANRASRISPAYVQALNGIETEFYGDTTVIEAWRSLIDFLNTPHNAVDDPNSVRWNDRVTELLTDMLLRMAESLDYHFDTVTLKRNAYYPRGWNDIETEQAPFDLKCPCASRQNVAPITSERVSRSCPASRLLSLAVPRVS